jgi:GT2 family glycosyltransferase
VAVVPAYINSFYFRLCLDSLARTRAAEPPYELIVVDNSSSDETRHVLTQFPTLVSRIIRNDRKLGFARDMTKRRQDEQCRATADGYARGVAPRLRWTEPGSNASTSE